MRHSFFFKSFWWFLIITASVSLLIVAYSVTVIKKWNRQTLADNLHDIALSLRPYITGHVARNSTELDEQVKKLGRTLDTRITVIAPDGTVLADSLKDPNTMENHGDRPEIIDALKGTKSENFRFSSTLRSNMLYLAIPLQTQDSILAVLRTSLFVKDIRSLGREIRNQILAMAATLLLLSLIVIFLVSKSISTPIKKIVDASRQVSRGNYDVQVSSAHKGEIGELTRSFNEMVQHQKQLFTRISNSREELETIVGSINEGLMVVDLDGKILLTNRSFNEIMKIQEPGGKKYWEVCRNSDFYDFMHQVIEEKTNTAGQLEINGKTFITSFNFIASQENVVITFHDISEIKRLETIKRDFISNVSHELKTPLTSIKGFIETMETESKEINPIYLEVIKRNTDRLINIVHDLLLLSRLEDKFPSIKKEAVDIKEMLETIVLPLEPLLKKKNLSFALQAEEPLPPVSGDPDKLEDLFVNLLDNAIKYTEKGEITVKVMREKNWLRCDIVDTGIGIPEKHVDRIFERFFVLDPSRSKASGGTGLGLSIVKHIVLMHGGTIEVRSTEGRGTTFTIRLPLEARNRSHR